MGYYSAVVGVLALATAAFASVGDNTIDGGDRVVLVAPVLAPPRDSRTHTRDRARQFPILVLLAQQNPTLQVREPEPKSLGRNPQPFYIQKLEDQVKPDAVRTVNRQKRHLLQKLFGGGGGGCYSCGGGGGGNFGGYQKPSNVVVVYEVQGGGGHQYGYGGHQGGYGGHQGGYQQQQPAYYPQSGCNGGCGGGGGGGGSQSWSQSSAMSSAGSSSYGYGRK